MKKEQQPTVYEKEFLELYRELDEQDQNVVKAFLKGVLAADKYKHPKLHFV